MWHLQMWRDEIGKKIMYESIWTCSFPIIMFNSFCFCSLVENWVLLHFRRSRFIESNSEACRLFAWSGFLVLKVSPSRKAFLSSFRNNEDDATADLWSSGNSVEAVAIRHSSSARWFSLGTVSHVTNSISRRSSAVTFCKSTATYAASVEKAPLG